VSEDIAFNAISTFDRLKAGTVEISRCAGAVAG
jgi:hypothetical protein